MTLAEKQSRMDALVGLPFLLLPGAPAEHVVVAETYDGRKLRAGAVQCVFNDALLMDAIEGDGYYRSTVGALNLALLEAGERLYGVSLHDALMAWRNYPKLRRAVEWSYTAERTN